MSTQVRVEAGRLEITGPQAEGALGALLAGGEPPPGLSALLAAAVGAAREPTARFTVTGLAGPVRAFADDRSAALVAGPAGDRVVLEAFGPSGLLGRLIGLVGLGPRPREPTLAPLALPVEAMARLLGERKAHHAGLPAEQAALLQEHLDAMTAHWRIEARGPAGGWYLEVVDTGRGLWTVGDDPPGTVTLTPSDATQVLDELAALPGHAGLGAAQPGAVSGA